MGWPICIIHSFHGYFGKSFSFFFSSMWHRCAIKTLFSSDCNCVDCTVGQGGHLRKKFSKYFLILHWDIFFSKLFGTSRFTLLEGKEGFLHFLQNLQEPCTSSLKQKCRYISWVHFILYQLVQGCWRFFRNEVWNYVKKYEIYIFKKISW